MLARDLMSTNLVVVPPETPVAAVAELLAARGISAVPVVDAEGRPLGIVTEGDLIRRLADEPPGPLTWFLNLFRESKPLVERYAKAHGATARDVMSSELVSVDEDALAERIAQLMEQHGIRRVLVLREGRLTGLVSRADLLRAILRPQASAAAQQDDRGILRAVIAAMREQPWVETFWVYPHVEGGKVTLYGFARSDVMRQGLGVLMRAVPGVKAVEDRMDPMPLILRATLWRSKSVGLGAKGWVGRGAAPCRRMRGSAAGLHLPTPTWAAVQLARFNSGRPEPTLHACGGRSPGSHCPPPRRRRPVVPAR
jgi:CBS domain-containing protein